MRHYLLFICILFFPFQFCLSQSLEEALNLRFSPKEISQKLRCRASIDSTQTMNDGSHPTRLMFYKTKELSSTSPVKISKDSFEKMSVQDMDEGLYPGVRSFYWSKMIVLPTNGTKKVCTATLNCKSEVDSLRFDVIAFDKKEKELYTDSVLISPTTQWTDYPLAFSRDGVHSIRIIVRYKGNENANVDKSVYLNRINIGGVNRL